jgi:hypothetical protein
MSIKIVRHTVTTPIIKEEEISQLGDKVIRIKKDRTIARLIRRLVQQGLNERDLVETIKNVKKLQHYSNEYIG